MNAIIQDREADDKDDSARLELSNNGMDDGP
jgi:hypothetical protein